MQWYEADVRQLEKRTLSAATTSRPAAFYGSSTIRLWETLAEDLGNPAALNLGFGGSTLEACAYFFDRIFAPLSPRSLTVYAGDNDLGDGQSPARVLTSFLALANKVRLRYPGIPFSFISIKPSPARFGILQNIRDTNAAIQREIEKIPNGAYIDVFPRMLTADGKPRYELFGEDGLHLSAAGYQLWAEVLSPYCNRIFTSPSPECHEIALSSPTSAPGLSQVVQP